MLYFDCNIITSQVASSMLYFGYSFRLPPPPFFNSDQFITCFNSSVPSIIYFHFTNILLLPLHKCISLPLKNFGFPSFYVYSIKHVKQKIQLQDPFMTENIQLCLLGEEWS